MTGYVVDVVLCTGDRLDGALVLADEENWLIRATDGTKRIVNPRYVAMTTIRERPPGVTDLRHPIEDQARETG